jgi:hypothetical protein
MRSIWYGALEGMDARVNFRRELGGLRSKPWEQSCTSYIQDRLRLSTW